MKTLSNRLGLFIASALAFGGMAYGQSIMKADIPFSFRAANVTLPAGSYTVIQEHNTGMVTVRLWNQTARRSVFTQARAVDLYNTGAAKMTFLCTHESCSLSQIQSAGGTLSYPAPHQSPRDAQVAAVVSTPLLAYNGR